MLQIIGILSGIISTIGLIPYIIDIFRRKTKPERATWLIWSVLGSVAFFSQRAEGATHSLWMTGIQTLNVILVFILSLKFGIGGIVKRDIISILLALAGLLLWYITKNPFLALLLVIFVDFIGALLTIYKSYLEPDTETSLTWVLATISGLLGVIAVGKLDFKILIYPIYIMLANFSIWLAIFLGKRRHSKIT